MPRISQNLINQARRIHPLLPLLLRPCRDLQSARLELKWLQQHVQNLAWQSQQVSKDDASFPRRNWNQEKLAKLCKARSWGVPLQYILGTEYFGDLELLCRPGVLIPRQATASMVLNMLSRISNAAQRSEVKIPKKLKILDLCSGTGCISFLIAHSFPFQETGVDQLEIVAVDISSRAINLAKENQQKVLQEIDWSKKHEGAQSAAKHIRLVQADLFDSAQLLKRLEENWDIIISNPPYISPLGYLKTTAQSVRNFEPKLALVPRGQSNLNDHAQADLFYPLISDIANCFSAKLLLVEVGDMPQAKRVASCFKHAGIWSGIEVWRDDPGNPSQTSTVNNLRIIGEGEGRSVFCWKDEALGISTSI